MKYIAKENQVMVAGYVGSVDRRTDSIVSVGVANNISKEEVEWVNLTFTNPREGQDGPKLADLADKYIEKGSFIAVVANEVQKGEYTNYYVVRVELGPRKR